MPDAANESPPPATQQPGQQLKCEVEAPKVIQGPAPAEPAREEVGRQEDGNREVATAETDGGGETGVASALADAGPPSGSPAEKTEIDRTPPAERRFVDALDMQRRMAAYRLSELVATIGSKSGKLSRLLEHFDTGRMRSLLGCLDSCRLTATQGDGAGFAVSPGDRELAELRMLRTWLVNLPVADQQLVDGLDRASRNVAAFQALAALSGKVDTHAAEVYAPDIMERDVGAVRDANHDQAFVIASLDARTVVDLVRGMLAIRRAFKP